MDWLNSNESTISQIELEKGILETLKHCCHINGELNSENKDFTFHHFTSLAEDYNTCRVKRCRASTSPRTLTLTASTPRPFSPKQPQLSPTLSANLRPYYVMIVLKGSVPISFGGNEQPAAYGELVSIGGLSPDVNKKLSAAISSILETKLSVPKSRFFLKFYDTKASPSESRICTMFACFTPALGHTPLSYTLKSPPLSSKSWAETRAFMICGVAMSFGGAEEPAAYGELVVSIGALNPESNKKLCAEIACVLETKLSVPTSRFFLKF
ncbi:hypothetical protein CR513_33052, partial [Mucuna pruriens]